MKIILSLVVLLLGITSYAQSFLTWQFNDRYFSIVAGSGQSAYFGELNKPNRIQEGFTHGTLALEARLWSKISGRISTGFYHIRGNDGLAPDSSWFQQRNLSFKSNNWEINLQAIFFPNEYTGAYFSRRKVDPYVALGIGTTFFNPRAELDGQEYKLRDYRTEDVSYSKMALTIPAAIGVKMKINPFINFNIEASYRYTFTDYLDDVSTSYPDDYANQVQELLSNRKDEIPIVNQRAYDELIPGGKRGNPKANDQYILLSIQLEFFLPKGSEPMFKKTRAQMNN